MSRVVEEVRRFLDRHGVAGPGIVAVSGGADSVALLRALLDAGAPRLLVAHFNHKLRGEESDGDERFVRDLALGLGVPVLAGHADVAAEAAGRGENVEATARRLRYDWLAGRAAAMTLASWIVTGHTADDQAETVLHRMIRGAGVQGLRGIAAVRGFPPSPLAGEGPGVRGLPDEPRGLPPWVGRSGDVDHGGKPRGSLGSEPFTPHPSPQRGEGNKILRPLLAVTRAEVLDYLAALGQPYRTDSSNADPRFTRNRIRHDLLPLLRTFNPEIVSVLGRLAGQAEEVFADLDADARALLAAAELPRAGDVLVLDAAALSADPPHRVRDALRLVWQREGWPADGMTFAHWDRLAGIARGEHPAADFPGGVHVKRVGKVVQLGRRP